MSPSPVSTIRWLLISRLRNDEFAVIPSTRSRRRQILPSSHALMRTWLAVGLPAFSGKRPDANADEGHSVDIDRAQLARVAAFLRRTTAVIPACCINHGDLCVSLDSGRRARKGAQPAQSMRSGDLPADSLENARTPRPLQLSQLVTQPCSASRYRCTSAVN